MTSQVRATYLKKCFAVFRIRRCLHWLSSATWSRVTTDHNSKSHDPASAGVTETNQNIFKSM